VKKNHYFNRIGGIIIYSVPFDAGKYFFSLLTVQDMLFHQEAGGGDPVL
jgi:hypothetical protein